MCTFYTLNGLPNWNFGINMYENNLQTPCGAFPQISIDKFRH